MRKTSDINSRKKINFALTKLYSKTVYSSVSELSFEATFLHFFYILNPKKCQIISNLKTEHVQIICSTINSNLNEFKTND